VLRGIKVLDDRFANPAYALLLALGIAMVLESGIPWSTFWIAASLVIYVVLVLTAVLGYTPTLPTQPSTETWRSGEGSSAGCSVSSS
jgi:hypothetical protein